HEGLRRVVRTKETAHASHDTRKVDRGIALARRGVTEPDPMSLVDAPDRAEALRRVGRTGEVFLGSDPHVTLVTWHRFDAAVLKLVLRHGVQTRSGLEVNAAVFAGKHAALERVVE